MARTMENSNEGNYLTDREQSGKLGEILHTGTQKSAKRFSEIRY